MVVEALKQTSVESPLNLAKIAESTRTTVESASKVLETILGVQELPMERLNSSARFKLASAAAQRGALQRVAKALTWQEFEEFSGDCLDATGFETQKGVILNDGKKRWQIDLTARRGQMLLTFDCKHWQSPNYPSKFLRAAHHARLALRVLLRHSQRNRPASSLGLWALPVIITLFRPRETVLGDVVLVSVEQLPDFLEHLNPYDPALPFISSREVAESPISQ